MPRSGRCARLLWEEKTHLFAGADCGGERAAAIYSLIGTANSMALIRRVICGMYSSASLTIQSIR